MASNSNLNLAARAKKDKFYTQLEDIENELRHYRDFFAGKVVLCNCDDPFESNFFKYFAAKFNDLELRKLICTSYADSPIVGGEISLFDSNKTAYMVEVNELKDWNGDGGEDLDDVKFAIEHGIYNVTTLTGDLNYCAGDFRSAELVKLLRQADVVVTNPPFSVFREYIVMLIDYGKKFLILGNKNAITYKEIFPLIKANKIWTGFTSWSGGMWFVVPYPEDADKVVDGLPMKNVPSIWYTNIETPKRYWELDLWKEYSPEEYPRYDNYDAIEVSKTADIPVDYFGVMGVPITFLDKYCPKQFELLGCTYTYGDCGCHVAGTDWNAYLNGKRMFKRLFIRRRRDD
ncbi:MAG: adenine-specific methyltransferase EcoRI family protein [Selenomonadaceae bacterium]|nr:adenine-specific methyltransferase EcoRI family protein [Selenomonadaceae bacterium]